ncbi:MAG: hypothetical protein AAGK32_06170 [Actinomycetota bacterium]
MALQPSFLDEADRHDLVGAIVGRHAPAITTSYAQLRARAERKARAVAAANDQDEVALSTICDHLHELLLDRVDSDDAAAIARLAIDTELELGRSLGRPDPEALALHHEARQRGIATAIITDSSLPCDLVARIIRSSGFAPDFVVVSSNEGLRKGSGLYRRLLTMAGVTADAVVHFGPDQHLDVEVPRRLGIAGHQTRDSMRHVERLLLGLNRPRGIDSLVLSLARQRLASTDRLDDEGYGLGYYAAGPLSVGFCQWLGSIIDRDRPDHLILCGPAGHLIDQMLDIVCPKLAAEERHVLPPAVDGTCPVDRLAATVPLRDAERVLVAGLGLFDQPHEHVRQVLASDGGPTVTGAYLGLPTAPDRSAEVWAFDDDDQCRLRHAAYRCPEVLEAMLRLLPEAAQDVSPALRPFHAGGRSIATGALTFAEDVQPWLHLDERGLSPSVCEPALRVITDPTPGEARILAPYPVKADGAEPSRQTLASPFPGVGGGRRPDRGPGSGLRPGWGR